MKIWLLVFALILPLFCTAQNRGNIWCFGDSAGIDFNNMNNPVPISTALRSRGSCASIADTSGNLLFYANDRSGFPGDYSTLVYNSLNNVMPHGDSIIGEAWYNEIIIIPWPDNDSLFYLLSISSALGPGGLYYAIIDIKADAGKGDVISKNNQLIPLAMTDCLNAVKHGNGRDWWIIARRYDGTNATTNNQFFSYLISPTGITNYQIQNVGSMLNTALAQLKFNREGNKMAFSSIKGTLELFDFDRCTGIISNPEAIFLEVSGSQAPFRFSCEFSPNSEYLYVCNNPDSSFIYQYDLNASNIALSETLIWSIPEAIQKYSGGHLKIAPDSKIYFSSVYYNGINFPYPYQDSVYNMYNMNLGVIHSPDSFGLACDFQPYSFHLGGKRTYWGLPNNPDYDMPALAGSPCDTVVGISESQPTIINHQLAIYYHPEWQTAFINANNLNGTKGTMEIFDVQGKMVHQEVIQIVNGFYTRNFNMTGMVDGMYFVNLISSGQRLSGKLVKY